MGIRDELLADRSPEELEKAGLALFGKNFIFAKDVEDTELRLASRFKEQFARKDEPPLPVEPWQMRLGASNFFVPPININVSQQFRAGGVTGSALRQQSSPKFNTGHTETVIQLTLYFPNQAASLGYDGASFEIDFDNDPAEKIDEFLSSLRGLIAQFKYAPFLPIKNQYLNQTYNITGVVLRSMSITTVEDYPFAMAVNLTLLKFNHQVYLPMIKNFDQAVDWGRFRQYMGRAVNRLNSQTRKIKAWVPEDQINNQISGTVRPSIRTARQVLEAAVNVDMVGGQATYALAAEDQLNPSRIQFYFPFHTPTRVDLPSLEHLKNYDVNKAQQGKAWWGKLLEVVGVDVNTYPDARYDNIKKIANEIGYIQNAQNEWKMLYDYLKRNTVAVQVMGPQKLEKYILHRMDEDGVKEGTPTALEFRSRIMAVWFAQMYAFFMEDPTLARALAIRDLKNRHITVEEWDLPMMRLALDPDMVIVRGISVSLGNSIASMQLQMQDEPVHQHIGGEDTRIDVSLTVFGEEDLLKIRTMFDSIHGLARLEHGHGVLGFLGVENPISEMCGVRYAIPLSFEVDTIPDYPHVYDVRISLTDFDVFQQKRETLTSEQQAELIEAFGKHNPFLRMKQLWGAFNAYPDFPLSIRDSSGKIVGHLDPDFYFRSFDTIDDDIVGLQGAELAAWREKEAPERKKRMLDPNYNFIQDEGVHVCFGGSEKSKEHGEWCTISSHGVSLWSNKENRMLDAKMDEPNASNMNDTPYVDGLVPPSGYMQPYLDDVEGQFAYMMKDMQYRDKAGRMIRAFPTYMLWLIHEGGRHAGIKMFDQFYGLQAVLDFSIVRSEDILGDTLVMRVSNLYSRLSTRFGDYLDENLYKTAKMINQQTKTLHHMAASLSDFLVSLDTIDIHPGVRVHLRMGYGSNPNSLETVFNGTITEVQMGDIITITCQSDAMELSALVDSKNKNAHSGKIDGSMTGLYLSEPRDLMVSLLTKGSSLARETIAHATQGVIFSENRFGIRHFGMMLYEPLTDPEKERIDRRAGKIKKGLEGFRAHGVNETRSVVSFQDMGFFDIIDTMWTNLNSRPDYEIFKRNIYPGNSTGIAQYMGGDIGDYGLSAAIGAKGVNPDGSQMGDPLLGETAEEDPVALVNAAIKAHGGAPATEAGLITPGAEVSKGNAVVYGLGVPFGPAFGFAAGLIGSRRRHTFLDKLGIINLDDDDGPFDEVSFRAQTHMKTVWDLFQVCAGLLPDYIVAVRPFEERSTIFYGKPHWLYTSGVIPVTTGVATKDAPRIVDPDKEMRDVYRKIEEQLAKRDNLSFFDEYQNSFSRVTSIQPLSTADPTASTQGIEWSGGDISSLKTSFEYKGKTYNLPHSEGKVCIEMHLPVDKDLEKDKDKHLQLDVLPLHHRHPFYMDRALGSKEGGVGGVAKDNPYTEGGAVKKGDEGTWPGRPGAFGVLGAEQEKWYMCMRWNYGRGGLEAWTQARILIYNKDTKKGVVCCPGDFGPSKDRVSKGIVAGCSPDVYYSLGTPVTSCTYRVCEPNTALGPVDFSGQRAPTQEELAKATATARRYGENPAELLPAETQTQGGTVTVTKETVLPDWAQGNPDVARYAHDYGWKLEGIPVDYSNTALGIVDEAGAKAQRFFGTQRSTDEANHIWDEFRQYFRTDKEVADAFRRAYKDLPKDISTKVQDDVLGKFIDSFMKFMWQNPWARGWMVLVVHKRVDAGESAAYAAGGLIGAIGGWAGVAIGLGAAALVDATNVLDNERKWDFGPVYSAFGVYIREGRAPTVEYMKANADAGKDQENVLARGIELGIRVISDIWDTVEKIFAAVGNVATGLMQFMRLSMAQLSNGLSMASNMQRQTNMLNRVYNDSIYYQAGPPNTVWRYADNPFTREYGEPVVEVREPFQRFHNIGSFQHIINNAITESIDQVSTVVTAVSNGKHPVTVHFDKAAPAHMQREKVVESGLFWDHPKGWFGIKKLLNPIETSRLWMQSTGVGTGGDATTNETSSKRIALWHLKESLKNIYTGELMIIGDATIRPYDLVFLGDVYERMYGHFEVEQVVHHFTPETGFITSITPNAVVTINDPARFLLMSQWRGQKHIQSMRNHIRTTMGIYADNEPDAVHTEMIELQEIQNRVEVQLQNSLQYTSGGTSVVKGIASWMAAGGFIVESLKVGLSMSIVGSLAATGIWDMWEYVRDNLLDQHGCSISYLTHNGQPMDAGLSSAQGVAVGQMWGFGIVFKSLKLSEVSTLDQGNPRIRTQDVIKGLVWNEKGPNAAAAHVDMFVDATNAAVRKLSGRGADGYIGSPNLVYWAEVTRVVDGDTFDVRVLGQYKDGQYAEVSVTLGEQNRVRLAASDAPEDPCKNDRNCAVEEHDHEGVRATSMTRARLEGKLVALRIIPYDQVDQYGRALAYVFNNAPAALTPEEHKEERKNFLLQAAGGWPEITWDSYTDDGLPYTYNWELITTGYADVYIDDLKRAVPGRGARGTG